MHFEDPVVPPAEAEINLVDDGSDAGVIVLRAGRAVARREVAHEQAARALAAADRAAERRAHADRVLYRA